MAYCLGIDGGGSKTTIAITDSEGHIVAHVQGGPSNLQGTSLNEIKERYEQLLYKLEMQGGGHLSQVVSVFAGIAGTGYSENQQWMENLLDELLPQVETKQVAPDMLNALYAGTYGEPGIVQIAGTGSTTYGFNQEGKKVRVGGWGYLFGDEGSGTSIGIKALQASLRYYDGRGEPTILLEILQEYYKTEDPQVIITSLYQSDHIKKEVAKLAPVVFQAADKKDTLAVQLIYEAASELTQAIETVFGKLFSEDDIDIPVILSGGLFQSDLIQIYISEMLSSNSSIHLLRPNLPPVAGSIIGGMILSENELTDSYRQNLQQSFDQLKEKS